MKEAFSFLFAGLTAWHVLTGLGDAWHCVFHKFHPPISTLHFQLWLAGGSWKGSSLSLLFIPFSANVPQCLCVSPASAGSFDRTFSNCLFLVSSFAGDPEF